MNNFTATAPIFPNFSKIFQDFTGLVYPEICCGCGGRLNTLEETICLICLYNLPKTFFHQTENNPVAQRLSGRIPFENATALYFFSKSGKVKKLIHQLKYKGNYKVGIKLGEQLGKTLNKLPNWQTVDIAIPIPLHPKRLKQRGYNQSEAIAEGLGTVMDLSVEANLVKRKVNNTSQTKRKDTMSRWENVKGIFSLKDTSNLEGKHFLILDDVITTGSTMEACAMAIREKVPDAKISFATVACADIF